MGLINLFYEEPDPDRWIRGDRFPRRLIRRIVRGRTPPGGVGRVFLNLRAGLDRLGAPYRFNDYRHLRANPGELACVVGKHHVLDKIPRETPILFGPGGYGHPSDNPDLLSQHNIRAILVLCEWMRVMCVPAWGDKVMAWPTGIDTDLWSPDPGVTKDIDLLIYDKIRWRRDEIVPSLLPALDATVKKFGLRTETIRYGFYREEDYHRLLRRSRAMVFLCEHETQGLALLQALSCDVPVFAWDRGGYWQDPACYPHKVQFSPVTSVPYWNESCGRKFAEAHELSVEFPTFWTDVSDGAYKPRAFVLDRLTLEKCARVYVEIVKKVSEESGRVSLSPTS